MLDVTTTPSKWLGAEPLALLPGIGASRRNFARVADDLAERFRLLAVDLPGHNGSPTLPVRPTVSALADAVEEVLDAYGLDRAHPLGDTLGGRVALELAQRGRALSVVAIAPSGVGLPPERLYQAAGLALTRGVARTLHPVLPALARHRVARALLLPKAAGTSVARDGGRRAVAARGVRGDAGLLAAADLGCGRGHPRGVRAGRLPGHPGAGRGGPDRPRSDPPLPALRPGSRFRLLPWAGHAPMSDVPEEIVRLVHEAAALAGPSWVVEPVSAAPVAA